MAEYDASGFNASIEKTKFQEYTVTKMRTHPNYDARNVYNNIAVLELERPINLVESNSINAACITNCKNMFDFKFPNSKLKLQPSKP